MCGKEVCRIAMIVACGVVGIALCVTAFVCQSKNVEGAWVIGVPAVLLLHACGHGLRGTPYENPKDNQ